MVLAVTLFVLVGSWWCSGTFAVWFGGAVKSGGRGQQRKFSVTRFASVAASACMIERIAVVCLKRVWRGKVLVFVVLVVAVVLAVTVAVFGVVVAVRCASCPGWAFVLVRSVLVLCSVVMLFVLL
jgi:hypothetical protein